jgi:predicted 2-oxoglutarate/Fe(II)-dependent dioxygenase YbiX
MSMSRNLANYLKVYEGFIEPEVCNAAVKNLDAAEWTMHEFYDASTGTSHSYDHELSVSHQEIPEKDLINKKVWEALQKYVVEDMKDMHEWFCGWNGYSLVRFNRYDPTTQMKLHCDHIHTLFEGERKGVPTLTVLGGLNDDYTGGEFVMWDSEVIKLPAGAVAVFPSNFLYPHEIRPVKSGVRYSYVSWAW